MLITFIKIKDFYRADGLHEEFFPHTALFGA